jgi:hypothetical protein
MRETFQLHAQDIVNIEAADVSEILVTTNRTPWLHNLILDSFENL